MTFPVPIKIYPQPLLYQLNVVPEPPLPVSVIFPPASEQKLLRSVVTEIGATATGRTVTVKDTQEV